MEEPASSDPIGEESCDEPSSASLERALVNADAAPRFEGDESGEREVLEPFEESSRTEV